MSDPVFPVMVSGVDSKLYSVESEDTAIRTKIEGGYVVSRPRHTRKPRKIFSVGYTALRDADKTTLQNFFDTVKGGVIFDWTDPPSGVVYKVRFEAGALSFKYTGAGYTHLWDVTFKLSQA